MDMVHFGELSEFHRFLGEKLQPGAKLQSPEEVLDDWREIHPIPELSEDDLVAIEDAIEDVENGDTGITLEELQTKIKSRFEFIDR